MNNDNTPVTYDYRIRHYKLGTIVGLVNNTGVVPSRDDEDDALAKREMYAVGHVVGYMLNIKNEVVVNVMWANQHQPYTRPYHPSKLAIIG